MNSQQTFHTPVLVKEVIEGLAIIPGEKYIDATLGGGGHALEIIKHGGILLGIDQDHEALLFAKQRLETESNELSGARNWKLVHGNFRDIDTIAKKEGFGSVAGILFDLGVSTFQIKQSGRGFSFLKNEPLDMRMDTKSSLSAFAIVNTFDRQELIAILMRFGEEEKATEITQAIVEARKKQPIETSEQLHEIVAAVIPYRGKTDPATKTFQALRIAVNSELEAIATALPKAITLVKNGGRIAVISFHSLEDRIVKRLFMDKRLLPVTKKPIESSYEEIRMNKASRSAKLRISQKII